MAPFKQELTDSDRDFSLRLIDEEIQHVQIGFKGSAWSTWAMVGAFSYLGWLAIGQLPASAEIPLDWDRVGIVFLSLSLLQVGSSAIHELVRAPVQPRYNTYARQFSPRRAGELLGALQATALAGIAWVVAPPYLRCWIPLMCLIQLLQHATNLFYSFLSITLGPEDRQERVYHRIVLGSSWICFCLGVLLIYFEKPYRTPFTGPEIRLGLLMAVLVYMGYLFTEKFMILEKVRRLTCVRWDVLHGRKTSIAEVVEAVDEILQGSYRDGKRT